MKKLIFFILFLVISGASILIFQNPTLHKMPQNIHAWAQADRYALALGFKQNNFDFFHPQTWVLNKQFPSNFTEPSANSITAVEFPINEFIVAILMKVFKSSSPFIFRIYILLYGFVGLFFLYKLANLIINNRIIALLITFFAMLSPVYIYYQGNFLPTVPSLSNAIIGLYFYFIHLWSKQNIHFILAILFLTLAALSRMPFAVYLISVGMLYVFKLHNQPKKTHKWIALTGWIFVLLYFVYNKYLESHYGSMFLGKPLPPSSIIEAKNIFEEVLKNWKTQYFSIPQYITFFIVLIWIILFGKTEMKWWTNPFTIMVFISFSGALLYCLLMFKQFVNHDYYFLDTLFLPSILILIGLYKYIFNSKLAVKWFFTISLFIGLIFSAKAAYNSQTQRWKTNSNALEIANSFKDSNMLLKKQGYDENAKVLLMNAMYPNMALNYLQRKGYIVMTTSGENIQEALKWDYNVIVTMRSALVNDIVNNYPDIIKQIEPIAESDELLFFKKREEPEDTISIEHFIAIDTLKPVFKTSVHVVNGKGKWSNLRCDSLPATLKSSFKTEANESFGPTFKIPLDEISLSKGLIVIAVDLLMDNAIHKPTLVLNIHNKNSFYKSFDLDDVIIEPNQWKKWHFTFQIPGEFQKDTELALYFWNLKRSQFYVKDMQIMVY